jgi:hypothetical protein
MVPAILRNGVIFPVDPLPSEWRDGKELWIETMPDSHETPEEIDCWYQEVDALCAQGDQEDDERLRIALEEAQAQAQGKAMVCKQMGLNWG